MWSLMDTLTVNFLLLLLFFKLNFKCCEAACSALILVAIKRHLQTFGFYFET